MDDIAFGKKSLWCDVFEAAEILGVADYRVRRACHRGEIPFKRFGRRFLIPRSALAPKTASIEQVS